MAERLVRDGKPLDAKVVALEASTGVLLEMLAETKQSLSDEERAVVDELLGEVAPLLDSIEPL
jgi:hypothetical protein